MDIVSEKKRIRLEMKALRARVLHDEIRSAAHIGVDVLFNPQCLNLFNRFRGFASYMSVKDEFPTDEIHREIFRWGLPLAVPCYQAESREYRWVAFASGDRLATGHMGIPEPVNLNLASIAAIDAVLIPGLAFDVCGGRIGYGGGVYDRLLPKLRAGTLRIALAFDFQVRREELPQAAHDLKMDYIVTEKQWIDCRLARQMRRMRNG